MLAVSDHTPARRSPSAHDHTGGRHRRARVAPPGVDDLGDRPSPRAGPQDHPRLPARRPGAGGPGPAAADPFGPFAAYCAARLAEDPHLWATTLFDEVTELGYDRSYPTFTRALRARGLRPHCEPCHPAKDRAVAVIEHPPGDETQWDWVELPDPPAHWGWGSKACLLVGALAHSGRWRGWLSASMDQPHLVEGLDQVTRALGGLTAAWRFDRMATVVHPESGRVTASFAAVAKHYGVSVRPCPPRRGNRKGVVEKANHVAAQRFWRTLADDVTPEQAQQLLDTWCARRGDVRLRATADGKATVATIAAREPLRPAPPVPFPAIFVGAAHGLGPGAGVLPRQPLQRRTRIRPGRGHRAPAGSAPATSTSPPRPGP